MKRRLFTILSALSLLLLPATVGCGRHNARDATVAAPLPPIPPVTPASVVPVVYAPLADPEPLTAHQRDTLLREAEERRPLGRDVWFLLVLLNRAGELNVVVHYTPDEVNGRVRRGRSLYYHGRSRERPRGWTWPFLPHDEDADEPPRRREVVPYVQVVAAAAKAEALDYIGEASEMPFRPPDGTPSEGPLALTDEELVAVVDLASRPPRGSASGGGPVHRIEQDGDRFRVYFGWQVAPLYGGGRFRELRRLGDGWIVLPVEGLWRS